MWEDCVNIGRFTKGIFTYEGISNLAVDDYLKFRKTISKQIDQHNEDAKAQQPQVEDT